MSIFNVSIQQVVADIRRGAFHPLDVNRALRDIKVKVHEVRGVSWSFPVELFGDVAPKLLWVLDGLFVELLVLLHRRHVRSPGQLLIRLENVLF